MITINGKTVSDSEEVTLEELIVRQNFVKSRIAVEINGTIISKKEYETTKVRDGDVVEVVSFVGGG